ncbi:phosphoribosyl-dephospho-CoA transferase MdcG domain-containing protein [Paludibacterium yongneupense]|uniref:phosphoribosyl-dephospho-CoA transferase MdcG domain-containing protein n=1 Tax=Paludibacterium yongneupense TaxID=400061 RepID=UPI000403D1AE|nr:phosphoribosyl-dephospho-CoA transferase MdcG domain-containing protein [Paludibacterium yongneupense]
MSVTKNILTRTHDMLFVSSDPKLTATAPLPAWATRAWLGRIPLAVRREPLIVPSFIPIRLLSPGGEEHVDAYVPRDQVVTVVTPESLWWAKTWRLYTAWAHFPAMTALEKLSAMLDRMDWNWGLIGKAGMSVASGNLLMNEASPLQLLLRADIPFSREQAAAIYHAADTDLLQIEVESPQGVFALESWLRDGHVALETRQGSRLTDSPWQAA